MDDEAILASLDGEPDRFALFYRRHAAALLDDLLERTRDPRLAADLCAETFAAALDDSRRFDARRQPAVDWLYAIARRLLADARPRDATRLAPLLEGHAAIFGIVPDGVTGARVTIAGLTEEVEARDNVIGAVLPFPYRDTAATRVAIVRD